MSKLGALEGSCQQIAAGDASGRIIALYKFGDGISIGVDSRTWIIFQNFDLSHLGGSFGNIESFVFNHETIHAQQSFFAVFFSGKLDPAVACEIGLFERVRHGEGSKSIQFFNN